MNTKITSIAKQLPPYSRTTAEILPYVEQWLHGQESRYRRKVLKIFENAGVDIRYGIMDIDNVFTNISFEEKNNRYVEAAIKLSEKALKKALKKAGLEPKDIDIIITVSCTGIMIPSVDAYLINRLDMKGDILRLPVTEMGCAAGISGIIYAAQFLKAHPNKRAAVIAVESPTATFQLEDFSMVNMVSAAIFGDGAAAAILSSYPDENGPEILGHGMYHFFDATEMMGFKLVNSGLQMILDKTVPETIVEHFPKIIQPFLANYNLKITDIDQLIFHPGGKKIVQTVEKLFGDMGKNIDDTREVLRLYGNMSSVTVLYVLERFFKKEPKPDELGLMLSFGPGFSAQRVLLKW